MRCGEFRNGSSLAVYVRKGNRLNKCFIGAGVVNHDCWPCRVELLDRLGERDPNLVGYFSSWGIVWVLRAQISQLLKKREEMSRPS